MFYQKKCLMEVSTKDVLTEDKLEELDFDKFVGRVSVIVLFTGGDQLY